MPQEKTLFDLFQADSKKLTANEFNLAKSLHKAVDATDSWKKSRKPQHYGLSIHGKKFEISVEEIVAWTCCGSAIREAIKFYSGNTKKILGEVDLANIFLFAKKCLHPGISVDFSGIKLGNQREIGFKLTPRAQQALEKGRVRESEAIITKLISWSKAQKEKKSRRKPPEDRPPRWRGRR